MASLQQRRRRSLSCRGHRPLAVGQLRGPGRSLRLGLVVAYAEFQIRYVTSALVPVRPGAVRSITVSMPLTAASRLLLTARKVSPC